jgi:hypothetical protein
MKVKIVKCARMVELIKENLLEVGLIFLLFVMLPFLKYFSKKRANNSLRKAPNEAPAKVRKLELTTKIQPFSSWITGSEKGNFVSRRDGVGCGNIWINSESIKTAQLYYAADNPMGMDSVNILRLKTAQHIYDFSIQGFYLEKINLPFQYEKIKTKIVSNGIKIAIVVGMIFLAIYMVFFVK